MRLLLIRITHSNFGADRISCSTWRHHEGTWENQNDTIIFHNQYQVVENDVRVKFSKDENEYYLLNFTTDRGTYLKNKDINIHFVYDYDAHLEDVEKSFTISNDNTIQIPYKDIPRRKELSAIRIEYMLNFTEKRYNYLTEGRTVNVRTNEIPNIINVEFVESPQKDTVLRTIKGIVTTNSIAIIMYSKTISRLSDYNDDLIFENDYIKIAE